MIFPSEKKKNVGHSLVRFFKNNGVQRFLVGTTIVICIFLIVMNGAIPKKYSLKLNEPSPYDITAPRDIENRIKTEMLAREASEAVQPVKVKLSNVPIESLNAVVDFFKAVDTVKKSGDEAQREEAFNKLSDVARGFGMKLSDEQLSYLADKAGDQMLLDFESMTRELVSNIMNEEINGENINARVTSLKDSFDASSLPPEMKEIGKVIAGAIIKENTVIDEGLTETMKKEAYEQALEEKKVVVLKDARILSVGDIVTEDKMEMLRQLNLLETDKFDYVFALGILLIIVILSFLAALYMKVYCRNIFKSVKDLILLGVITILTLLLARVISVYSLYLVPVLLAPILISLLLDLRLAIVVNVLVTMAVSLMAKGDMRFIIMAVISGTLAAFIIANANQRSKLSAAGFLISFVNILVIISMGIIEKQTMKSIAYDSLIVAGNGIGSAILAIGLLPFLESTFNVVTPLKLLELANPNHPLLKRLMVEAPGTYHHSLMVGNLAEVAAESIHANPLLARVGAYYHDVGKLERPHFFKENQLSDNPHDRMTANLSSLVITSHTRDGVEIAEKYRIPAAIRDIILQHHGTTLVAFFYHKAQKSGKLENTNPENFRYEGPKPATKEAAVVMLADSVEAAIRAMQDKTEGKIEGLIRKIIQDKLNDGQLSRCDLTLKDIEEIARSFAKVFSGFLHKREEYPAVVQPDENVEKPLAGDDPLDNAIGG